MSAISALPLSLRRPLVHGVGEVLRGGMRLHYALWRARHPDGADLVRFHGLTLEVWPGVFHPLLFHSTACLAEALERWPCGAAEPVLDLGCGSGALGLLAARQGARVIGVDLNPCAAACAARNAARNRLASRYTAIEGDLFAPLAGQRFERVLFNPPFWRGVPRHAADLAFRSDGVQTRFAAGLAAALLPGGRAWVVLAPSARPAEAVATWRAHELEVRELLHRRVWLEPFVVYELRVPALHLPGEWQR